MMKILYVADNPHDAESTKRFLSNKVPDLLIEFTADRAQAETLLAQAAYDVILIGFHPPQGEGLHLFESIQNSPTPAAVVILVSPGDEQSALHALKLGASEILVKTTGYLNLLPATIENALSRSRLVIENQRYRSLFEGVPIGIFRMTVEGNLLEANPAMLKILRLEKLTPSAPANLFERFVDPALPEKIQSLLQQQDAIDNLIAQLKQNDSSIAWIDLDIRPVFNPQGETLHLEGTVKDISERALAEQAHQHVEHERFLEQAILLQLAQSLLSTNDVQTVMERAVQESAQGLSVPYTALALMDETGHTFSILAETGYPSPVGEIVRNTPLEGQTEISYVIAHNTPAIIPQSSGELPFQRSPHVEKFGIQSSLVVPMSISGQQIGAMIAESPTQRRWKDNEIRLLTLLASTTEQALQRARFFQQVQQGQVRLGSLSKRLVEVQENERHMLARELHDQVGQTLTALKMNIQLTGSSPQAAPLAGEFQTSLRMIEEAIRQVRDLSRSLRPSILDDFGLEPALRWHLDNQAQLAGFSWDFEYNLSVERLPEEIEIVCFRVAQVALTNVVNHAKASHVRLSVRSAANTILMDICDNGQGFDVQRAIREASHGKTLGLLSMIERTELLGGKIQIESQPGNGACVHLQLPMDLGSPVGKRDQTRKTI